MKSDLKEKLLLRMFASIEYVERFVEHFVAAMDAAENGVAVYKKQPPTDPKLLTDYQYEINQWETKVLPNFRGMKINAMEALSNYKNGKTSTMRSCTGSFRGLSKDMDGVGEEWWQAVDSTIRQNYYENLKIAGVMGDNILFTIIKGWRPGELLKESITGPIDEQDLLRYLNPGETV
jgi:hypothetical protein